MQAEILGMTDAETFTAIKQRLLDEEFHLKKNSQVKSCRFGNWVDAAAQFDKGWTWTVLRLLHYAISEGMLSGCAWQELFKASGPRAASASDERVSMAQSNEVVKRFRAALKSNVQLALAMMLEPMCREKARLFSDLAMPIRAWYGHQSTRLRSAPAMLEFMQEQICGGGLFTPLRQTLAMLSDISFLERIGLQVYFPGHHKPLHVDHPLVAEQDAMACLAARYAVALVASRWKRLEFLKMGWTGRQVEFLSSDPRVVECAVRDIFAESVAFEEASKQTSAFWRLACKRSYFNLASTQQLLMMLRQKDRKVSPEMAAVVANRLRGAGQSKVSEDCVNKGRSLEHRKPNKQQQPAKALWSHLIDTAVASELHHYEEPAWRDRVGPQGSSAVVPSDTFSVKLGMSPSWVGKIIGASRSTPWFSTTAAVSNIVFSDAFLMRQGYATSQWNMIEKGCLFVSVGAPCDACFVSQRFQRVVSEHGRAAWSGGDWLAVASVLQGGRASVLGIELVCPALFPHGG